MAIQLCSAFRRQITGTPAFYQTQVEQNINAAAGLAALGAQASCLLSSVQKSCKKPGRMPAPSGTRAPRGESQSNHRSTRC